jgi:bis(5'-nucleosyl)-tetraphosphatase (symmetrical)
MRYCDSHLRLLFDFKHTPDKRPYGYFPWYDLPRKIPHSYQIIFGHWSTLGLYASKGVIAIDTGCLWGGQLTALNLSSIHKKKIQTVSIACPQRLLPDEGSD